MVDLTGLKKYAFMLASVEETDAPVVSCYLQLGGSEADCRRRAANLVRKLKKEAPGAMHIHLEQALHRIGSFLRASSGEDVKGAAIFLRGGLKPLFQVLEFALPVPDWLAVDWVPCLYQLAEIENSYHQYVLAAAKEDSVRVAAISGGEVVREVSRTNRGGHFASEQAKLVENMLIDAACEYWILAAGPRWAPRVKRALSQALAERLAATIALGPEEPFAEILAGSRQAFREHRERESLARADKLRELVSSRGPAVAGSRPSAEALRDGSAEWLIMARSYDPEPAWVCRLCGAGEYAPPIPASCPQCGGFGVREIRLKEELVRLAKRAGSRVEIVHDSGALEPLGGVGCLLRGRIAPPNPLQGLREDSDARTELAAAG